MTDPLHDIALDVSDLVRTQREMLLHIERLLAVAGEHLVKKADDEEPPEWVSASRRWLSGQDMEDWGGDQYWSWRAYGFYFGYPDCCVDAFVENGGNSHNSRGLYHHEDGTTGHAMCEDCEADPDRARRLAKLARARRTAPVEGEAPF